MEKCKEITKTKKFVSKNIQNGKKTHGRIEKRTTTVFYKNKYKLGYIWDESIKTIIKIKRKTKTFDTKTKQFIISKEEAFYISTIKKLSAKKLGEIIRSHWKIENTSHYVKDVSMHEDFSRIRKNPENIATLRSWSLNLLRANGEKNISQALYRNTLNVNRVLNYKGVKK